MNDWLRIVVTFTKQAGMEKATFEKATMSFKRVFLVVTVPAKDGSDHEIEYWFRESEIRKIKIGPVETVSKEQFDRDSALCIECGGLKGNHGETCSKRPEKVDEHKSRNCPSCHAPPGCFHRPDCTVFLPCDLTDRP